MKRKIFFKVTTAVVLSAMMVFATGCSDKDYYNPDEGKDEPKSIDEYFDFSTRADVTIDLNYGFPGYKALFNIYTENPLEEDGFTLKSNLEPVYKAFTKEDNTFSGKVSLPTAAKKVYLYTNSVGLPHCVELNIVGGRIAFNNETATRADEMQHTSPCVKIEGNRVTITNNKLHALYTHMSSSLVPSNNKVSGLYGTVGSTTNISSTATASTIGALMGRVNAALRAGNTSAGKQDNSALIRSAEITNITVKKFAADGITPIKDAHIDLVTLSPNPGWINALGYYYYKSDETPTAAEIKALPKFMVFPKLTNTNPAAGVKVRLQFFGENYNENGTDDFPAGYTIGWCLMADLGDKSSVSTMNTEINAALSGNKVVYSNYFRANQVREGFITILDQVSGKLILGIEDTSFQDMNGKYSDKSYEDMLFYVDADPIEAITGTDIPVITPEEILSTETTYGTLAFEDIWPTGGDYDMNDVVVEYSSAVTFNQDNEIKKIVDTFKPVHDGAIYRNAFGYVIGNAVGDINEGESNYSVKEENNQFILFPNAKEAQGQLFNLTREFAEGAYPNKANYSRNYNPFIVVNYEAGKKNRTEVHLPKTKITSWADPSQVGVDDDAYFIDKDGTHPFAIDLPSHSAKETIGKYKVPVERTSISIAYPQFDAWVTSNGANNTEWYKNPASNQVQE